MKFGEMSFRIYEILLPQLYQNPGRSCLRQPDLAVTARVCKLWHSFSEKQLYTHIVSDDLPSLLTDLDNPSRQRQLARTKSLRIEYSSKVREPTYEDLLEDGGEMWCLYAQKGENEEAEYAWRRQALEAECDALKSAFNRVIKLGSTKIFPKLESIAVASIYSNHDDGDWVRLNKVHSKTINTSSVFRQFLGSSTVQHLCIRDIHGPLSYPLTDYASLHPKPKVPLIPTIHFNQWFTTLPILLGGPSRWVSEIPMDWNCSLIFRRLAHCTAEISCRRRSDRKKKLSAPADLDIYFMSAEFSDTPGSNDLADPDYRFRERRPLIQDEQDAMPMALSGVISGPMREASGLDDQIRLIPSYRTPVCLACGTGPPVFKPSKDWNRKAVHTERMAKTGDCSGCKECMEEKRIKDAELARARAGK